MSLLIVSENEDSKSFKLHLVDGLSMQLLLSASLPVGCSVNDMMTVRLPEICGSEVTHSDTWQSYVLIIMNVMLSGQSDDFSLLC